MATLYTIHYEDGEGKKKTYQGEFEGHKDFIFRSKEKAEEVVASLVKSDCTNEANVQTNVHIKKGL
jgi:hypothetical protein